MPKSFRFLFLLAFAVVGDASPLPAQQNLFNVPSAEITPGDALFFQQQFNLNRSTQSNTTIAYGLGHDFEIGLNLLDLELIHETESQSDSNPPLFLVNAQQGFELNETFRFGIGTQIGQTTTNRRTDVRLANFSYLTGVALLPDERGKLYAGTYFADWAYRGGRGNPFGFLLGYDIPIVKDRFNLVGDYISGQSDISVAVLGGVFQLSEHCQLSVGAQLPSPRSGNPYGSVIELTYVPGKNAGEERREPVATHGADRP